MKTDTGFMKVAPNNTKDSHPNARISLSEKFLSFLGADVGDMIHWSQIEDVLCREIVTMEIIKSDGSPGKKFTLAQPEKDVKKFEY